MFKSSKLLLLTIVLFVLTACGGGSTTAVNPNAQKEAQEKIAYYAQSSSNPKPTKEDYINAGVENLTKVDIDELNALVSKKNAEDVDTLDKLNILAQTIMDMTAPVITLKGDNIIFIVKGTVYTDEGATAKDDKDGTVAVTTSASIDTSIKKTYTVIYTATDKSENKATKTRTVNVVEDVTPPIITITTPLTVKEGETFTPTATATDSDENVEVRINETVDTSKVGETYTITYTATDSVGLTTTKTQDVTVVALTITELFEKSKSGEIDDVSYIVVGDSTRYYEGTNDVLINSRNSDEGYYRDSLNENITFKHSSMEGQSVHNWLNKIATDQSGGKSFTKSETLSQIGTGNPKHTIVEFSMGINDFLLNNAATKESVKTDIRNSILALQATGVKILLVSPVPYFNYSETSHTLNDIYQELESEGELNLPFVSGYNILLEDYPSNTLDNLHPKVDASKKLVDTIILNIENGTL